MKTVAPPEWDAPLRAYEAFLRIRDLSPHTIELRTYHVRILGRDLNQPPFDVTLDDLTTWLGTHDWGKATQAAVRSSVKVFYSWAEKTSRIEKSPATDLPRIKPPQPKPNPVTESDYTAALAKADPRIRMALRLAGDLGMRRAEVAQVHRDDLIVTDQGHLLRILGKGRKERIIPIGARLAADLIEHIDTHGRNGFAFPSPSGGHITPHWLGNLLSHALPEGYTGHKLRHRALTQAYDRSKDILLTSKLAGHSSVATTQTYYVAPNYAALRSIVEEIAS